MAQSRNIFGPFAVRVDEAKKRLYDFICRRGIDEPAHFGEDRISWGLCDGAHAEEGCGYLNVIDIVDFDAARTDELVRMWRESFEFGVGVIDPHPIEDQRDHFVSAVVPSNAVRIALLDANLVGFIAATKESITHLYVRIGHHRCGVGSQLLSWAKAQSDGKLWLFAFARNAVARAFYEKQGFEIIAHGFEPTWQLDDIKYEWVAKDARA